MARGARVGVDVSGPSKGYVVRGMAPGDVLHEEARDALGAAVGTWTALVQLGAARPRIFRVHDDGREERLPSYEEALAMRPAVVLVCRDCGAEVERGQRCKAAGCVDPLAALEAAERRLLEAGGWTVAGRDVYGAERWTHPTWKGGAESLSTALTIERRRLAAKGGA